jgi:hypothetical protein
MSQLLPERRSRLAPERWEPLTELEQATERMRRMLDQTGADGRRQAPFPAVVAGAVGRGCGPRPSLRSLDLV